MNYLPDRLSPSAIPISTRLISSIRSVATRPSAVSITTTMTTSSSRHPIRSSGSPATSTGQLSQTRFHFLVSFIENLDQIFGLLVVIKGKEGVRSSQSLCTTCSADTMYIVLNVVWEIIIDDYFDILDIWNGEKEANCMPYWLDHILKRNWKI